MSEAQEKSKQPTVPSINQILGRALIVTAAMLESLNSTILKMVQNTVYPDGSVSTPGSTTQAGIDQAYSTFADAYLEVLSETSTAAWVKGSHQVAVQIPKSIIPVTDDPNPLLPYPQEITLAPPNVDPPIIRFPGIEKAVQQLARMRIALPTDLYDVHQGHSQALQPITAAMVQEHRRKTGQILTEAIQTGDSYSGFKARFLQEVGPASNHQMERVFRDMTNIAVSRGKEDTLKDPQVDEAFPYAWTSPIKDGRLTRLCAICSKSGINGTPVFARWDPS